MSRVFYAVAREGGLPKIFDHVNPKSRAPDRVLVALLGGIMTVLVIYYIFQVDLETALLIPSGAAILIYVIGSVAGLKILAPKNRGFSREFVFPLIALGISLLVLPFIGSFIVVSFAVVLAALAYATLHKRN